MSKMVRTLPVSFLLLAGCVTSGFVEKVWDLGSSSPQVTVRGPSVTRQAFTFTLTLRNVAEIPVCFDGNEAFVIGLGLRNAYTGATLSWVDGPISPGGGGGTVNKYMIEPEGTVSASIRIPRPISGPYIIPFVQARYEIGDRLVAVASQEFYPCEYSSTLEAMKKSGTLVIFSTPSAIFQE